MATDLHIASPTEPVNRNQGRNVDFEKDRHTTRWENAKEMVNNKPQEGALDISPVLGK